MEQQESIQIPIELSNSKSSKRSLIVPNSIQEAELLNNSLFWNVYGHLISDGGVCPSLGRLIYCNNEEILIQEFINNFGLLFGKSGNTHKIRNTNLVQIYSKQLANFFNKLENNISYLNKRAT